MTMTEVGEYVDDYRALVEEAAELNAFKTDVNAGTLTLYGHKEGQEALTLAASADVKAAVITEIDDRLTAIASDKTTIEDIFSAL